MVMYLVVLVVGYVASGLFRPDPKVVPLAALLLTLYAAASMAMTAHGSRIGGGGLAAGVIAGLVAGCATFVVMPFERDGSPLPPASRGRTMASTGRVRRTSSRGMVDRQTHASCRSGSHGSPLHRCLRHPARLAARPQRNRAVPESDSRHRRPGHDPGHYPSRTTGRECDRGNRPLPRVTARWRDARSNPLGHLAATETMPRQEACWSLSSGYHRSPSPYPPNTSPARKQSQPPSRWSYSPPSSWRHDQYQPTSGRAFPTPLRRSVPRRRLALLAEGYRHAPA